MYFLSIEPSTKNFALAVSNGSKVLKSANLNAKLLEDAMVPAIDKILASAKLEFGKIEAFVVGIGPGSFTSLRVGLSTVKAFAMATARPVVGISSLEVIAQSVVDQKCDQVCVILDARRKLVYSALYANKNGMLSLQGKYELSDIKSVTGRVHGKTLFVGDGIALYKTDIQHAYKTSAKSKKTGCKAVFADEKYWFPQAQHLAKLGFERLCRSQYDDAVKLVPLYLYAHDCQVDQK